MATENGIPTTDHDQNPPRPVGPACGCVSCAEQAAHEIASQTASALGRPEPRGAMRLAGDLVDQTTGTTPLLDGMLRGFERMQSICEVGIQAIHRAEECRAERANWPVNSPRYLSLDRRAESETGVARVASGAISSRADRDGLQALADAEGYDLANTSECRECLLRWAAEHG